MYILIAEQEGPLHVTEQFWELTAVAGLESLRALLQVKVLRAWGNATDAEAHEEAEVEASACLSAPGAGKPRQRAA